MEPRNLEAAASASPPSAPGTPSNGYPTNGNPATGIPASKPGAYWFYQIAEELRYIITAAGLTPSSATLTQLAAALITAKSLATNGYIKFGPLFGNLVLQWGQENETVDTNGTVTFPVAFPTACLCRHAFNSDEGVSNPANVVNLNMVIYDTVNATNFKWVSIEASTGTHTAPSNFSWFAIGH